MINIRLTPMILQLLDYFDSDTPIKLNLDELHLLAWEVDFDCSETMHQEQSLR